MEFKKYNLKYYRVGNESLNSVADRFNVKVDGIETKSVYSHNEGEFVVVKNCNVHTHIVKPMDTVESIAKMYNVDEDYIISQNNLKNKRMFIGQKLRF